MTVREQMSKNLAFFRKNAGYTLKSAAAALGTKITTISSWERGVSQPNADMLVSIAMLYGVSLSDLYGIDPKEQYSREEKDLVRSFRSLNPDGRYEALAHMDYLCSQERYREDARPSQEEINT